MKTMLQYLPHSNTHTHTHTLLLLLLRRLHPLIVHICGVEQKVKPLRVCLGNCTETRKPCSRLSWSSFSQRLPLERLKLQAFPPCAPNWQQLEFDSVIEPGSKWTSNTVREVQRGASGKHYTREKTINSINVKGWIRYLKAAWWQNTRSSHSGCQ